MFLDNWDYYDTGKYIVVVNTFQSGKDTEVHTNVYKAKLRDIAKDVSVHNVMVQMEKIG